MEGLRMTVRNYRAHSIEEAITAAREDLGPDAVILSTRTCGPVGFFGRFLGNFLGNRRAVYELTAASPDGFSRPLPDLPRWDAPEPPAEGIAFRELDDGAIEFIAANEEDGAAEVAEVEESGEAEEAEEAETDGPAEPLEASEPAPAPGELPVARRLEFPPAAASVEPKPAPVEAARGDGLSVSASAAPRRPDPELDEIRTLVGAVLERKGTLSVDLRPPAIAALARRLEEAELDASIVGALGDDLVRSLPPEALASPAVVRAAVVERLAALLPPAAADGLEPEPPERGGWRRDGRPHVAAFIGPTGVGKTTTVAKIAAGLRLRYGARVALVTSDTYRIAAVEQLRTYAEIIGLPLEVVRSPGQMVQACLRLSAFDVILVDTAGRGQKDRDRIDETRAILDAAAPHERHLVLSAVAGGRALSREAEAFAAVGVDRVLLTKLDEAVALGPLFRVLPAFGRPLSHFTSGQEVPHHIEPARPRRLAELLVGLDAGPAAPEVRGAAETELAR
jgi:flagellar biosynthesis protein FlhF